MKTIKISDVSHRKLTATVGTLMAQTGKMQTYQDAIEAVLNQSVKLPSELLAEIENFIETNKHLGFATREEFIRDATRWRLKFLRENFEYLENYRKQNEGINEDVHRG
ncbi:MAG: ribbon-helix-helix domain-containing protein [Fervidobacterium sp.]